MKYKYRATSAEICPSNNGRGHYWVIETPDGDESVGVCKLCGEVRRFRNTEELADEAKFTIVEVE